MAERITAAAVKFRGVVWTLPAPARHHHILWAIDSVHPGRAVEAQDQGFMTSGDRYVDRIEAKRIALTEGQILENEAPILRDLYSENVW